jgi:hypothetical protein
MKVEIKVFFLYKENVICNAYSLEVDDVNNLKAYVKDILNVHHADDEVIQIKYAASLEMIDMVDVIAIPHTIYQ